MGFLFLLLMAVICAAAFVLLYKFFKKDGLYLLAIGGAVSANIFNIGSFGIPVGSFLIFGIDSIIYTLFIFCVLVVFMDYGKKSAMALTYSCMGSIFFTALIQLIADWATKGFGSGVVWGMLSFLVSILATYVAIVCSIWLYDSLKNKLNRYVNGLFAILLASITNSLIYFGLIGLFEGGLGENFLGILSGSYIGKLMASVLFLVGYAVVKEVKRKDGEIFDLVENLKKYEPFDEEEKKNVEKTLEFLQAKDDENCYVRENMKGHVTSGGLVVGSGNKILLDHHKKLDFWVQFGGHNDGEQNCVKTARREIYEEAGLKKLILLGDGIADVGVYDRKDGDHYDINFIFKSKTKKIKMSDESKEIKWFTIPEAKKVASNDKALTRLIEKYKKIISKK